MKTITILVAGAVAVSMAALNAQVTETNYTTGFFNDSAGWTNGDTWQGQDGWTGSGGTDASLIWNDAGRTPGGAGNNSGLLGAGTPTSTTATLNHTFTPMDTLQYTNIAVSFAAEFSQMTVDPGSSWYDTYVMDLKSGSTSALSFTTADVDGSIFTLTGLGDTISGGNFGYDYVYRMQVDIVDDQWSANIYLVDNPTTTRDMIYWGSFAGGQLANGLTASDIDNLDLTWTLASGNTGDLGATTMLFNELSITSTGEPIPEPGTWAVGALLLSGAALGWYRRRKAGALQAA